MKFLKSIIIFIKNLFNKKKNNNRNVTNEVQKSDKMSKNCDESLEKVYEGIIGLAQHVLLDTKFIIKSQGEPIVATVTFPKENTSAILKRVINSIDKMENIKQYIFFNTGHFLEFGILHSCICNSDIWLERIDGMYEAIRILDIKKVKNEEKNENSISLEIIFEFMDNYMGNFAKIMFFSRDPNEFFKISIRWKIDKDKITPNDSGIRLIGFDLNNVIENYRDKYREVGEHLGFEV